MLAGMVPSFLPFPTIKQDPQSYWETHRAVFARTRPAVILVYPELEQGVVRACRGLPVRVVTAAQLEGLTALETPQIQGDTAVALLQHSSGTTGLKKGVALSYGAISSQIGSYAKALELHPSKRELVASWLPLYHDMGLIACFLLPMYLGIEIVSLDAFEWTSRPYLLLEAVEAKSATHVWLPNFAFNHIARATPRSRRYNLSSLRSIINCSEPCKPATFAAFLDRFQNEGVSAEKLQVCYAMAETVFAVTNTMPGQPVRDIALDRSALYATGSVRAPARGDAGVSLLSNGQPIEGVEVCVLRDGQFVSDGSVGEICVRASFLFSGYFMDSDATKDAMIQNWYRTGDLGFVRDGHLYVTGRLKDIIIVNGRNYYAHDIEEVASGVRGLKPGRAVAFGVYVPSTGSEQIVVVAERETLTHECQELMEALSSALSRAFGIAAGDIRVVDPGWLVKTTSGKISRGCNALKYVRKLNPTADALPLQAIASFPHVPAV
jgi:acyl-CoA synthetase (AMP-forming)/AMP-acid ligase II